MRNLKKKILVTFLAGLMAVSSVAAVYADDSTGDVVEDDYILLERGDYTILCGADCNAASADAYTAVYPERLISTSEVYVAATLYVKDKTTARVSEYGSDSITDSLYADISFYPGDNVLCDKIETVHNMMLRFQNAKTYETESFELSAEYEQYIAQ